MASSNIFVWYELMTSDLAAAETFYSAVLGWRTHDAGMPDMRYTLVDASEGQVAGMMTLPAEAAGMGTKPGWTGYIGVADCDAAARGVVEAGGAVHRQPEDIPGVGRFAVVADPNGAGFCLFQAGSEEQSPAFKPGKPGHAGWNELHASDWQTCWDFYAGQFGWAKAEGMDMGPMGIYQLSSAGGDPIGAMYTDPQLPHPAWLFYWCVDDIDDAGSRLTGAGGTIVEGPHKVPGDAWIIQARDPQGAAFALVGARKA